MTPHDPLDLATVRGALFAIPPDCGHNDRAKLAFAVHDAVGEAGGDVWLEWAAGRSKPDVAGDRATWRSARKPGPVKAGTLFRMAQAHGWRWPAQAPAPAPTPAELKARAQARREAEAREATATAQRQREAAAEAVRLWEAAADVTDPAAVPYLARKGIGAHGVRVQPDGTLLVPARDASGELVNLQRILPAPPADGPGKLFIRGARKAGTWHMLGDPAGAAWLLVAEGYATAASLHEATGRPAVCAWDAGNLGAVVRALRGAWPAARLALCADDDRATEARTGKNPGRAAAEAAAKAAGKGRALVILPTGPGGLPEDASAGTDFNDAQAHAGRDAVRELVEAAIAAAESRAAPLEGQGSTRVEKTAPRGRQRPAAGTADDADDAPERSRDRFRVDEGGLWFDPPGGDDGDGGRPVRVCGPLHVEALARDLNDGAACLVLQFDAFGKARRWLMPLAMLAGDGTAYRAELLAQGFITPADAKRRGLLTAYLQTRRPAEWVRTTDRVGWHGRAYVLPRETLGDDAGERLLYHAEAPVEAAFAQRGTLEGWRASIGRHCADNARLAFFLSLAFAGPLLAWAPGTDGGGFHLVGDSSTGKTTALRVAASLWGGRNYLQRWRATDNGLEALAAQHSDALLCLDELAQLDARVAGEAAYMLANGQGKSRAGRTGAARPRATWRVLFASAGEVGLSDHMAEAGKRPRAGQELRLIDLPADAGTGCGLFDVVPSDFDTPADFARHLERAAELQHGTAGRAWLLHLVAHTAGLAQRLRDRMDAEERAIVPEAAAGQVQRVGRRFALVAAAGELATEASITGWPAGTASAAARRCFAAWLAGRPAGIGQAEDAAILAQVRQWFTLHGEARFVDWRRADDDHAPKTMHRAGWRKPVTEATSGDLLGWEWFVSPDVFAAEVARGYRTRDVLRLLKARGHLHTEPKRDGYTCKASPPGADGVHVYRLRSSLLGDVES